jgi:hypothetical protein
MNWKMQAVAWLRGKASEQAQNNERWPEHAKCYPSWTERVEQMQHLANELEREARDEAGHQADEATRLRALLRRGMRQLEAWQEKYGEWQPQWLPPAGDVRWAEDVEDALKTPNAKSEGAEPLLAKLPLD